MKLYYFETINPQKVCAVAQYLNSPVEFVRVDLGKGEHKTADYLAINPNGKVPALQDGELKLWEADAIMCHLARIAKSDLWPTDGAKQVEVMRWLSWNADHFTRHAGTLYFEYIIKPQFALGEPDPAAIDEARGYVDTYGAILDDHLTNRTFLLGDHLTIADFAVAITLPYAQTAKLPLQRFSHIARWHDLLSELPAWREPFPQMKSAA